MERTWTLHSLTMLYTLRNDKPLRVDLQCLRCYAVSVVDGLLISQPGHVHRAGAVYVVFHHKRT